MRPDCIGEVHLSAKMGGGCRAHDIDSGRGALIESPSNFSETRILKHPKIEYAFGTWG